MNKRFFLPLLYLSIIVFSFSSCSKKNDSSTPKSKTELISNSPWIFQSATASGNDVSNRPEIACFIDNVITFLANGNGSINEGTIICSPSTAGNFTWNFASNETILTLSTILIPGGSTTFDIVTLNETNLVLSQTINFPPSSLVVVTFKH